MSVSQSASSSQNVWVFAELRDGVLAPVVMELLGEGRKLADTLGHKLCAVLLTGSSDSRLHSQLQAMGLIGFILRHIPCWRSTPPTALLPYSRS